MRMYIAAISFGLVACASTGVVPMDSGTFMIAKTSPACGFRSADETKAVIYAEAHQYCALSGKETSTISLDARDGIIGVRCASAQLTFRCLDPSVAGEPVQHLQAEQERNRSENQHDMAVAPHPVIVTNPTIHTMCTRIGNYTSCTTN